MVVMILVQVKGQVLIGSFRSLIRLLVPSPQTIEFKALAGRVAEHVFPVRNAGNLPFHVRLEVAEFSDVFTVTPEEGRVDPGQDLDVTVNFKPTTHHVHKINR